MLTPKEFPPRQQLSTVKEGIPLYTPLDLTGVCCQTGLQSCRLDRCEGQVLVVSGQIVGYVRVSAADQNPQRQLEALGECHKIFTDKISGKSRAKRQALAELLGYIRDDDTVRIASMDRLGRDTRDLYNIVAEIIDKGAAVEFVSENITVDKNGASPMDSLMLGILAAFADFERRRIKERQAEGIAIAKAKGKYKQQPKLSPQDVEQAQAMIDMGIPKTQVAATFEVSRQTLYTALRRAAE